jgi:hypothetical protein
MVYNLVSTKVVISKVLRDLKVSNLDWTTDAVEWVGDVVERIGSFSPLVDKRVTLKATNFKIDYPADLESVTRVYYKGNQLFCERSDENARLVYQYQGNYYITGRSHLICSLEQMEVELHYKAFPLDEDNYPLIPDNFYYKTACFWYIASRLALREQIKLKYEYCEERFNTYAQLAENDCAFPTPERMEVFKERWLRIVPNLASNPFGNSHNSHNSLWLERDEF